MRGCIQVVVVVVVVVVVIVVVVVFALVVIVAPVGAMRRGELSGDAAWGGGLSSVESCVAGVGLVVTFGGCALHATRKSKRKKMFGLFFEV